MLELIGLITLCALGIGLVLYVTGVLKAEFDITKE